MKTEQQLAEATDILLKASVFSALNGKEKHYNLLTNMRLALMWALEAHGNIDATNVIESSKVMVETMPDNTKAIVDAAIGTIL